MLALRTMDKFRNSLALAKVSWKFLLEDRKLLIFPILASIGILVTTAMILGVGWVVAPLKINLERGGDIGFQAVHYAVLFCNYFVAYTITIFFNVALVGCITARMEGQQVDVSYGLGVAGKRLGKIFVYSLISSTVGVILSMIRDKGGFIGEIVSSIIGIVWNLAVYFVVPYLVVSEYSAIDAIKKSAALFKGTWGERVIGNLGLSFAFNILFFAGLFAMIAGIAGSIALSLTWMAIVSVVAFVVYCLVLALVSATLTSIYNTMLFRYATGASLPRDFNHSQLQYAFIPKQS